MVRRPWRWPCQAPGRAPEHCWPGARRGSSSVPGKPLPALGLPSRVSPSTKAALCGLHVSFPKSGHGAARPIGCLAMAARDGGPVHTARHVSVRRATVGGAPEAGPTSQTWTIVTYRGSLSF